MRISTKTATGVTWPDTAPAGDRALSWLDGPRTASDTGPMSGRGAGPGWKMSLGDLLLSTTDVGRSSTADGSGCRDRSSCDRSGLPLWWLSWAVGRTSASPRVWAWDGSRWRREKSTSPDIT